MKTPPRRQTPAIEPPGRGKLAGFFADHRAGLGAIVVAAAAIAAAWSVWSLYGERIRGQPDALLHPGQVTVRGVPNWVTTNLVAEALHDLSQEGIGLVETNASVANTPALSLFTKLGFETVEHGTIFRKP